MKTTQYYCCENWREYLALIYNSATRVYRSYWFHDSKNAQTVFQFTVELDELDISYEFVFRDIDESTTKRRVQGFKRKLAQARRDRACAIVCLNARPLTRV